MTVERNLVITVRFWIYQIKFVGIHGQSEAEAKLDCDLLTQASKQRWRVFTPADWSLLQSKTKHKWLFVGLKYFLQQS